MDLELATLFSKLGHDIFSTSTLTYPYNDILTGTDVKGKSLKAISHTTWRSFERKNKRAKGVSEVFENYFKYISKKSKTPIFIERLRTVRTPKELDNIIKSAHGTLYHEFNKQLSKPIDTNSYGKLRKIIDVLIEHAVSMSNELAPYRSTLTPLLYLPLTKPILSREEIFSQEVLEEATKLNDMARIKRTSTFGDIKKLEAYNFLQQKASERAQYIKEKYNLPHFHRIYFDLFWGDEKSQQYRYTQKGRNLFELNP